MFRPVLAACLLMLCEPAAAQNPLRVVPGWGVDTTAAGVAWSDVARARDVRDIYRRWAEYLHSNPRMQRTTSLWSAAEQRMWPHYDLTASIAYQGSSATVLDIRPAPEEPDTWIVKTLFASTVGPAHDVKPIALTRVYAIREAGAWVFSNALPRLTREWRREVVGPITYVLEPGYPFDRTRAENAVQWADSVAVAFGVGPLDELTYYLTGSPETVYRIIGVDWGPGGTSYGYASYGNRLIFSGVPAAGEDYRHELAHFVLGPLQADGRTHRIVSEGVATWLGGSMGRDFDALLAEYATYLRVHPDVTLDTVLEPEGPDRGTRPAGAVLAVMAFERGGIEAVKMLLASGRTDAELRSALEDILRAEWPEVVARWRARAMTAGGQR